MASGTVDKVTGKIKEAVGKLTGDKRTEAEGHTQQAKGGVKNATGNVSESAKGVRDGVSGRPEDHGSVSGRPEDKDPPR